MKQKIQVTTAEIHAPAQVVLPNTYFVSKAVKAQFAIQRLKEELECQKRFVAENHRDDLKCVEFPIDFIDMIAETSGDFLNELIDALEGKEENHG
jgi:hypothetical protein